MFRKTILVFIVSPQLVFSFAARTALTLPGVMTMSVGRSPGYMAIAMFQ